RYSARLYGFLVRYLGDLTLAEDALQETFFRALRSLKRYDRKRPFAAWVYKIALNTARDILESSRWEIPSEIDPSMTGAANPQAPQSDLSLRIKDSLKSLSPEHRSVFILYFWEGFSYQEIAKILDCPVGTVKSRMHYGSVTMKRLLKDMVGMF
ncbi:MAG: RNA polymerase sigma factor, partial [Planctomycetota bacterium]|nr:RNA polymerase sigma factor [Planctomycetota bacterium]